MVVVAQEAEAGARQRGGDQRERRELRVAQLHRHQRQRRGRDRADARGQSIDAVDRVHRLRHDEDPEDGHQQRGDDPERMPVLQRIVGEAAGAAEDIGDAFDADAEREQDQSGGDERQRLPLRGQIPKVVDQSDRSP